VPHLLNKQWSHYQDLILQQYCQIAEAVLNRLLVRTEYSNAWTFCLRRRTNSTCRNLYILFLQSIHNIICREPFLRQSICLQPNAHAKIIGPVKTSPIPFNLSKAFFTKIFV
jgi:hypothetical protein